MSCASKKFKVCAVFAAMALNFSSQSYADNPTTKSVKPAHWTAPGILLSILLPELNSGLDVQCEADVLRPDQMDPPLASDSNKLRCVSNAPKDAIIREWSFGPDSPVSFWGNRADRKLNFSVDGPFAKFLFVNLGRAFAQNLYPDMVTNISVCGPGGGICTDMYSLERDATGESPASLLCSADSENGEVYAISCVFLL